MKRALNAWTVESSLSMEETFAAVSAAGFEGIELNVDPEGRSPHALSMATTAADYAAIRELNAITKVMQGSSVELEQEFELGDLFNSTTDKDKGTPVFDYAFFVDNKDSRGVHLSEISDYEKMVAQLVYMQLYSPMVDDMYSEEDNLFQAFVANDEPKYGACGVAKAVYPVDSVRAYSAMRAVQDS